MGRVGINGLIRFALTLLCVAPIDIGVLADVREMFLLPHSIFEMPKPSTFESGEDYFKGVLLPVDCRDQGELLMSAVENWRASLRR